MIVIRSKVLMKSEQFMDLYADLIEMAKKGVVLLPNHCELLNEVPPDTEVVVVKEKARDGGSKP